MKPAKTGMYAQIVTGQMPTFGELVAKKQDFEMITADNRYYVPNQHLQ